MQRSLSRNNSVSTSQDGEPAPGALTCDIDTLETTGVLHLAEAFGCLEDAWTAAGRIVVTRAAEDPVEVIGEFVIPPLEAAVSRHFQTLHFDFGLPLIPGVASDMARFTALHVPADRPVSEASTRFVPLRPLLAARRWPKRDELLRRFAAYGTSHGAWDDASGYVEGSLARLIEASLAQTPELPSVKTQAGFLCGEEFASLGEEQQFLTHRGLSPDAVGFEICLGPGELLIFDNLAVAHGRRGRRQPGELHQRVFGHRQASIEKQSQLRDRVLMAFSE